MKVLYFILSISFGILFLANFIWTIFNLYMFLVVGIDSVLTGKTLIENIYYSEFLRWIILADIVWLIILLGYVLKRKSYKTDSNLHYLQDSPIKERQICVIMPAFNEELFGPVFSLTMAQDEEHAIDLGNNTSFGLGAAVFTENIEKGESIAKNRIDAGVCFVNDFVKSDPRLPFGGIKESGYGRELSSYGMMEFVNIKTVAISND